MIFYIGNKVQQCIPSNGDERQLSLTSEGNAKRYKQYCADVHIVLNERVPDPIHHMLLNDITLLISPNVLLNALSCVLS